MKSFQSMPSDWEMPPGEIATVNDVSPDGRYISVDHANRLLIIDTATGKVAKGRLREREAGEVLG